MNAIKVDFNLGVGLYTSVWLIIHKDVDGCMEDDYDISYQIKKNQGWLWYLISNEKKNFNYVYNWPYLTVYMEWIFE